MTRAFLSQTNFSAGELDPRMLGRSDLRSFENGAAKLRNVWWSRPRAACAAARVWLTWHPPPVAVA
jgi:hypothetical protein